MERISSVEYYKYVQYAWLASGLINYRQIYRYWFIVYSIVLNGLVTLCGPIHLVLGLFSAQSLAELMRDLTGALATLACSAKVIAYFPNFGRLKEFESLLKILDERVVTPEDRAYYNLHVRRHIRHISLAFGICFSVVFPTDVLGITGGQLMYDAWFPFDWRNHYLVAVVYQASCIFFQLIQNFGNDVLPAMMACLVAGHAGLLGRRVARVGYDAQRTLVENERELIRCIEEQRIVYDLYNIVQAIILWPMLVQFMVTAMCMCVGTVGALYASTTGEVMYYGSFSIAILLEIFPLCYFGTCATLAFHELPMQIYACNWPEQSRVFKKNMLFFVERSASEMELQAGGIIHINLATFFATIKGTYSLFTLISSYK